MPLLLSLNIRSDTCFCRVIERVTLRLEQIHGARTVPGGYNNQVHISKPNSRLAAPSRDIISERKRKLEALENELGDVKMSLFSFTNDPRARKDPSFFPVIWSYFLSSKAYKESSKKH